MLGFLLVLSCPVTIFIGFEKGWTANDKIIYKSSQQQCEKYYPDSPCVIKFTKTKQHQDYQVICGEER